MMLVTAASASHAESNGTWACKLDSKEWKNDHGGASMNAGQLTLYSGDDAIEGIYIMMGKPPAVGSFALNDSAQASFSDTTGANHKSKAGTGTLVISKFSPPEGDVKGKVEGTFSSNFEGGTAKEFALKDCTFSLPVKNL